MDDQAYVELFEYAKALRELVQVQADRITICQQRIDALVERVKLLEGVVAIRTND